MPKAPAETPEAALERLSSFMEEDDRRAVVYINRECVREDRDEWFHTLDLVKRRKEIFAAAERKYLIHKARQEDSTDADD